MTAIGNAPVQNITSDQQAHSSGNSLGHYAPIPLPPDPNIPSSGMDDPTQDPNFPPQVHGQYQAYTFDNNGYMQVLLSQLKQISSHPMDTKAFSIFMRTVSYLSQIKALTPSDMATLDKASPINLLNDGIEHAADFAFLFGYGGQQAGTWGPVQEYLEKLQTQLQAIQQIPGADNEYIRGMLSHITTLLSPDFQAQFMKEHIATAADHTNDPSINAGDIIWRYYDASTNTTKIYDMTTADNNTKQLIERLILNSGTAGNPNPDIDTLDQSLTQMEIQDLLNTFNTVFNQTHDVGTAILAFMFAMENDKMSVLSGSADTMDQQHQINNYAEQVQDDLKGIGGWDPANPTQAHDFRQTVQVLFDSIDSTGQFSTLSGSLQTAYETLNTTMIPYTNPSTGKTTQTSVWSLLTDPHVKDADFARAMQAGLTPPPPTPDTGGGSSGGTDPGTEALQGVLGGLDGVVTAISSNAAQATTASSQLESLIQAIDKLGTGVIDPNNGMDTSLIKSSIQHQISN